MPHKRHRSGITAAPLRSKLLRSVDQGQVCPAGSMAQPPEIYPPDAVSILAEVVHDAVTDRVALRPLPGGPYAPPEARARAANRQNSKRILGLELCQFSIVSVSFG